jgi:hypothetical protein
MDGTGRTSHATPEMNLLAGLADNLLCVSVSLASVPSILHLALFCGLKYVYTYWFIEQISTQMSCTRGGGGVMKYLTICSSMGKPGPPTHRQR